MAGAIALGAWVPTVTASAATPDLPAISAQQLVAKVVQSKVHAFSGKIDLTANLGLPDLGAVTGGGGQGGHESKGFDPTTLLSGTHQIQVWERGPDQRLALPSSLAETDFVHSGDQAWLYDSATQTVTRLVSGPGRPQRPKAEPGGGHQHPAGPRPPAEAPGATSLTPGQIAHNFLDHLGPSTSVSVASPVYVAGRSTYQLQLAPRPGTASAATSTVSQVAIAVDSKTGMPLQVEVLGQGQRAPALKIGFSSIDFSTPSASAFAAPTSLSTKTKVIGHAHHAHQAQAADTGAADPAGHRGHAGPSTATSAPTVAGAPWAQTITFTDASLARNAKQLDAVTTPVTGAFGSARLLTTNLASALVFPDGKVVVGLVSPSALEAAAAG